MVSFDGKTGRSSFMGCQPWSWGHGAKRRMYAFEEMEAFDFVPASVYSGLPPEVGVAATVCLYRSARTRGGLDAFGGQGRSICHLTEVNSFFLIPHLLFPRLAHPALTSTQQITKVRENLS